MWATVSIFIVLLALVVGAAGLIVWWVLGKDVEQAFKRLVARFVANALRKGDIYEEATKKKIIAQLQAAIKIVENIDVVKPKEEEAAPKKEVAQ